MNALVEIHSEQCACKGAAWLVPVGVRAEGCPASRAALPPDAVVASLDEWRALGRPNNANAYQQAFISVGRAANERRSHQRFRVVFPVLIACANALRGARQEEVTVTEVVSASGAEVSCSLALSPGDVVIFEVAAAAFKTRAEVVSVRPSPDGRRTVGIRFRGALLPSNLIPDNAKPV